MLDVVNLALPFFGLILLGKTYGKLKLSRIPAGVDELLSDLRGAAGPALSHSGAEPVQ
jgi:hypothetical protein